MCVGEIDLVQFPELAYIDTVVNTDARRGDVLHAFGGGATDVARGHVKSD